MTTFASAFRTVEVLATSSLKPNSRNPRTHSRQQISQIANSIRAFGFTVPIVIDGGENVLAGHGRLTAAKMLGLEQVPVIRLEKMSAAQKRAYALADNKLAEQAGWDRELLAIELQELSALELDFDITVTGFEIGEIDVLINELGSHRDAADELPAIETNVPPVTQLGDLWVLGKHKLLCADARDPKSFTRLLGETKAELVFTDPPYNVPMSGHASGLGRTTHPNFVMGAGEFSLSEFTAFLRSVLSNLASVSVDGAIHFVCMDWRHLNALLAASQTTYAEMKNLCVWVKTNGGMGSLYRSQHELIGVFKVGQAPYINNVALAGMVVIVPTSGPTPASMALAPIAMTPSFSILP